MEIKLKGKYFNENNVFELNEFLENYGFDYIINENELRIYINTNLMDEYEIKEFINDLFDFVKIDNLENIKFVNN